MVTLAGWLRGVASTPRPCCRLLTCSRKWYTGWPGVRRTAACTAGRGRVCRARCSLPCLQPKQGGRTGGLRTTATHPTPRTPCSWAAWLQGTGLMHGGRLVPSGPSLLPGLRHSLTDAAADGDVGVLLQGVGRADGALELRELGVGHHPPDLDVHHPLIRCLDVTDAVVETHQLAHQSHPLADEEAELQAGAGRYGGSGGARCCCCRRGLGEWPPSSPSPVLCHKMLHLMTAQPWLWSFIRCCIVIDRPHLLKVHSRRGRR